LNRKDRRIGLPAESSPRTRLVLPIALAAAPLTALPWYDAAEHFRRESRALEQDVLRLSEFVSEGHCDERGSNEYNMALGEHRALAVRAYLEFAMYK